MSEVQTPSKSFKIVHGFALVFLFLILAQPTFDNVRALLTGTLGSGDMGIAVTASQMVLHVVAMLVGWVGFVWFVQRKRRGAYASIVAHALGFTAVFTQTPEMLDMMPAAALVVFFVLLKLLDNTTTIEYIYPFVSPFHSQHLFLF